jgi:hypothetical protein
MSPGRLGLVLAIVLSIGLLIASNLVIREAFAIMGEQAGGFGLFVNALNVLALTSIAVGVVIRLRVHANRIGILLIVGALGVQAVFVSWPLAIALSVSSGPASGLLGAISIYANIAVVPALFLLFPAVGVLFPDGRLPGPRWRLPFWAIVGLMGIGAGLSIVAPWDQSDQLPFGNPLALPGVPAGVAEVGGGLSAGALFAGFALAVAAIVVRFRRAGPVERAQIKWLVAAITLMAIAFPVSFGTDIGSELVDIVAVGIGCLTPIAIGIAILRYRLYEIDRLVSRTVSWAIVTGGLLLVFGVMMIGLQALLADLTTQGGTVAVAVSTLVAASLFQPLRQHVQRAVDRRFDRVRYDAERTAEAFAQRLSTEVDLATLTAELRATAGRAVRPATASIWLAERGPR